MCLLYAIADPCAPDHASACRFLRVQSPIPLLDATHLLGRVWIMRKNTGLDDRLALWQGVSTDKAPQYPPPTPQGKPHGPHFPIIRDSCTDSVPPRKPHGPKSLDRRKLALERVTIPQYRNQTMREFHPVPRETPKKAYAWYAPDLLPSECTYKIRKKGKHAFCTITHNPTSLSISCQAQSSTRYILRVAEFRLSRLIALRRLELVSDEFEVIWMDEMRTKIKERHRRILTDAW